MQQDQHTEKRIKENSKENRTRQQMKPIDKLNQAKKGKKFRKAAKILPNQNQNNNEQLLMKNQKAADAFGEKIKKQWKKQTNQKHIKEKITRKLFH